MDSLGSDLKIEMEEKERMLEQLKLMVREKDEILRKKDSEMQDAKANLSKFKLQSKAKITKLTHQLEEAKKASISDNASDKSSECGDDTPTEQANRAKMKLFRRKLEDKDRQLKEKDDQINNRDQQMIAKEKIIEERNQVIQQREEMIRTITDQLHERDKIIKYFGQSENQPSGEQVPKIDQIYAQILYKDKLIVDLNNKILELDRKIIDLQEFAGEKDEVVKGRDKVISVLQMSMVEKDQNVTSQSALIKKLTGKVETYEENLSLLKEKLENAEHSLKVESERFNLRLNETQKYFEETLSERESEISQLRVIIREREKDVATRDNDLRELLLRHEQDLQEIMSRGEGSMQDHVVKMLEQKLKDINGVLDSKVQVIEVLTSDVSSKDQQLLDIGNTMKSLKEKLAVSTEQNLLQQQTFADLEMQWKEEKSKLEARLRVSGEKLEEEKGELNLQLHTLQTSLKQYEAAYSQAAVQYNALQERYQQAYLEVQELRAASSAVGSPPPQQQHVDPSLTSTIDTSELLKQLESETALRKKVEEKLNSQQEEISRLQNLQMSGSFSEMSASGEKTNSNSKQRQSSPEKSVASSKSGNKSGDKQKSASDTQGSKASEAKLLKIKAQYTAKIKTLEKEVQELKKSGGGGGCAISPDVETLQNRLAEVEEEKGQLEQQLSETQKQNQTLQNEMQQLQQQLQEAQFETSHLSERISQMQEIDQQIRMEFANEKAAILASEEAQKMQLTTQLNQLREECNRLGNQIQEDMKERDHLYQQFQRAEQNINELQAQVQASNAAVEELQKNLIERSEQTSKLAGEKIGLEVRAAELEEIRDQLEQEKSDLLTKIESLQNRIEFDNEPAIAFEKESQNLQEKIQELTLQISKEKGISKAQKEEINKLLPKLDQMETEKFQLEEEKKEMKEHLITLTQEKEETDTLLRETKSVLESLQRGEESMSGVLHEKEKENMDLKTQLADMRKTLEHQNHEIICICKALELKNISVEHLSNAVQNRISSISDLQGKLEKAEKELEKALEIGMKRETKLESLKSQLKNHKEMETSVQKMTEECDSYKDDLLTKDQTIQLLQETVESQNNEMQKFHELQKTRDQILSSLELKVEEYESNNLEMNKEHNVKTQTLETRIESLQKELDAKIQEVGEVKSKAAVLSKELESKAEELHKFKIKSTTKSNETDRWLTEMDNEMKGLKVGLQEKTEALKKHEEHNREISVKISQLQDDNFAKNSKIESLSKSLSEFSEKCNELSRLHTSANNEKEYLTQQIQEYRILEESARGLLTKQQLEVMMPHEKEEQERPVLRLQNYLSHISAQLQELRAVKMQAETSLLNSNKQNNTLKQKLQESETLCSEKDSQLLNMKSDSSEHKVMLQGLVEERDQKISSLQQELNSINTLLEEKQTQLNTLQANLLTKDSELSNITSHLEMAKQHEAGLKDELNSLREDVLSKETANATLQTSVAEQHEKDLCVNTKVQNLQSELEKTSGELANAKEEMAEVIKKLIISQKHAEDLEEMLKSETETKVAKETQLQDALSELTAVQSQLKSADLTIDQLQSTSCDLMKGQEEVAPLKVQLEKREEQLQNLSSQLAELIQNNDDQQGKLAKKDEKIMSLLENMQELEEQLTSLGNQREADVGQLTAELAEKSASLEEAEKSLQAKETHYIKVLATAKRLKQQGEIAKKEAADAKSELKELQEKMTSESLPPNQTAGQIEMPSSGDVDSNSSERLQELTTQVESFSEYCQQLQLQVQTLSEKLHTAEQMANTKQMQLEVLQALSDEKESFAASQSELLEGFEKKLVDVQEEKETLANVVVGKEELIQTLRDRAEELDRKLKSLETETEKDARIRLLNEQLDESGKTMHSLQEEISRREEKLTESKQNEAKKKEECEQITEQLKRAEEVSKAKHEISEQLASQIFDLSEQFQAKCVHAEELSTKLKSTEEKFKVLEVELAERESSLDDLKQKLMTSEEGERLVDEMKNFKELYNSNLEKLTAQQEVLKTKEDELLEVQRQLDRLKGFLQTEDLLGRYKDHLDNLNSRTVVQSAESSEPVFVADDKRPLDQTVIEFPDTNFSGMYESLKLEFDLVFSEKERLILENFELKKLLTAVQDKEKESILKQKSYETRIGQLEDNLHVSRTDMASLEESLEDSHEKLCKVEEQNKQLLKEKENLTLQIADLLAVKKGDDSLVVQEQKEEKKTDDDQNKVPFVEKVQQEFQSSVYQVRIERDNVQRSASEGPMKESEELERMKGLYEKLSDEHERLKNKHQVADVKCEKMLIKLKAFKEKNDSLLQELSQLKESQKEGIGSVYQELEAEKQNHQETQNLLLAEQAILAKERAKVAKMETAFRSKFQEVLNEKNHLSGSCDQLKSKCKELGARLKELLAERQDLQDSIDHLISESQTSLESMRNEHVLEKSSLENKISSLEVECKNSYADLEDFQKLVAKMKESQEFLKSENQKLKDVAHRLKDEMFNKHSVEEKIDHLELEVQGLQEERNSLQDQVDAAREEALTKMKELQGARKKLADAEGKLKLQQEQVIELKELSETLQSSIFSLEADLQASQHHREFAEKEKDRLSEEITVLQKATANTEILKSELSLVEHEVERKEQSVVIFKHEVETLNEQVQSLTSQCRDLESTRQAITVLKKENGLLTEDVMKLNAENADLRSAREELGVVSERYNNLLQDNTALAKQIEELLTQLQKRSQLEKDLAFAHDQHGHLEREQATFIQRIEDLEEQSQQLTNENTQLKQEMVHVNSSLKQMQFENESLKSQLQVMQSGGDRLSRFQEEYEKLQMQFAQSVEQNNKVQAELNHSTHRLQLRDARCQQLAMQVSQLAEDRSYLNIQMGNLSLALREKEKDASNLASQCQAWHHKHSQLQQKVTELETGRAEALKLSNTQPLTSEIETLKEKIRELEVHQEDMMKQNLEQTSQFTSEREQRLLAETNLIQLQEQIQIMQQKQSVQDYQIQIDDDQEQILDAQLLLSRQSSSYLQRLQRWLMVRKEYLCFSSRQLHRLMRIRPGVRTLVRIYFLFLHIVIAACIFGFL